MIAYWAAGLIGERSGAAQRTADA